MRFAAMVIMSGAVLVLLNLDFAWAESLVNFSKIPDNTKFNQEEALKFNNTAKARAVIYTRLADYLVERFGLETRRGIGIDLGGGPGDLAVELARRTSGFYWINTDINAWNSYLTMELAGEHKVAGNVGFVFADACWLPFRDNYADLIVSRGSYQFWGDLATGIKEIYRVLKPGGSAFIGRGFPPTAPEEEVRALRAGGLARAPKYVPQDDVGKLQQIASGLGATKVEVLRHQPEDRTLNYGLWLIVEK